MAPNWFLVACLALCAAPAACQSYYAIVGFYYQLDATCSIAPNGADSAIRAGNGSCAGLSYTPCTRTATGMFRKEVCVQTPFLVSAKTTMVLPSYGQSYAFSKRYAPSTVCSAADINGNASLINSTAWASGLCATTANSLLQPSVKWECGAGSIKANYYLDPSCTVPSFSGIKPSACVGYGADANMNFSNSTTIVVSVAAQPSFTSLQQACISTSMAGCPTTASIGGADSVYVAVEYGAANDAANLTCFSANGTVVTTSQVKQIGGDYKNGGGAGLASPSALLLATAMAAVFLALLALQ